MENVKKNHLFGLPVHFLIGDTASEAELHLYS